MLEIRAATKLGLNFPVGPDNRHRVNFWPFGSVTGRCTPSSSSFMLAGGSPAFRHLAKPAKGEIFIEADWSAQEIWIAAYLSGDKAMQRMLQQADPYIAFGEMAGVIPAGSLEKLGVKECKVRGRRGTHSTESGHSRRALRQDDLHSGQGMRHINR